MINMFLIKFLFICCNVCPKFCIVLNEKNVLKIPFRLISLFKYITFLQNTKIKVEKSIKVKKTNFALQQTMGIFEQKKLGKYKKTTFRSNFFANHFKQYSIFQPIYLCYRFVSKCYACRCSTICFYQLRDARKRRFFASKTQTSRLSR